VDSRFTKLEKTVEKIHEDFKAKIFEGLPKNASNIDIGPEQQQKNGSMTLDFDKENKKLMLVVKSSMGINMQWNDVFDFVLTIVCSNFSLAVRRYKSNNDEKEGAW
jgi:hypothetical protein